MKTPLNEFVAAVLAGSPISVEAKKAGVHPEQIRRKVQAHPDYAKAKVEGKLRKPGLPGAPELDAAVVEAAITDVVGGMTDSAIKHGVAASTLTKKFHQAHPGVSLPKGGAGGRRDTSARSEVAKARVTAARLALEKAEAALYKLDLAKPQEGQQPAQ